MDCIHALAVLERYRRGDRSLPTLLERQAAVDHASTCGCETCRLATDADNGPRPTVSVAFA